MALHPSEADIVGRTVRQANRLEDIDSVDEINIEEVNYTVTERSGITAVEFVVAFGGPTMRVEALSGIVSGSWGGDTHRTHFDSDVVHDHALMLAQQFEKRHDL